MTVSHASCIEGYAQISQLMSQHREFTFFRRFGDLSMVNLLYMQAELMHLEEKYYQLFKSDNEIYQQTFLARNPKPKSYDLNFFREWLTLPSMGNYPLRGIDRKAWSEIYTDDLMALHRRQSSDPISWEIYISDLANTTHETPLPTTEITQYSDSAIHRIFSVLGTLLACLLPISSIIVLYFVSSMKARLGFITAFTAVFAMCLASMTGAKRVEIFTATSAFAAVQVVFVSGTGGNV
ncbi:hypothetical protein BGZ60DRAFT_377394 [Tricladium varicosporioides]|nr:hypothetical protein BGZ60DRAFT_377394 [Hymenoscyphus varicosporioides]